MSISAERRSRRYTIVVITQGEEKTVVETQRSKSVQRKLDARLKDRVIDPLVAEQFNN